MSLLMHYKFAPANVNLLTPAQSLMNQTNDAYGFASFSLGTGFLKNNTTYTLTICGYTSQVANADSYLRVYVYDAGWSYQTWSVPIYSQKECLTTLTFTTGANAQSYNYCISAYHFPSGSAGQGNTSTVKWYKLEEGSVSTPFTSKTEYTNFEQGDFVRSHGCKLITDTKIGHMALDTQSTGYVRTTICSLPSTFTICGWVKFVGSFTTWARIFDFGSAEAGADYAIGLATSDTYGTITLFGRTGGGASLPDTAVTTAELNKWYHYAIVVNGTNLKFYWNNVLTKEFTINKSLAASYYYNYLGKSNWAADGYSRKYMSDFRVYDTALSAEDITKIYYNRLEMLDDYSINAIAIKENSGSNPIELDDKGVVSTGEFVETTRIPLIEDPAYETLEYIESTGSQYIDTRMVHSQDGDYNMMLDIDYEFTTTSPANQIMGFTGNFGSGIGTAGTTWWELGGKVEPYNRYFASYNKKGPKFARKVDNLEMYGTTGNSNYSCTMLLFAANESASNLTPAYFCHCRLYSARVGSSQILDQLCVPARRKSDGAVGLYNIRLGSFYTNKGSGSFIAGPVRASLQDFTKLEYIQTSGTQAINTNCMLNTKSSWEITFAMTNTGNGQVIAGTWSNGTAVSQLTTYQGNIAIQHLPTDTTSGMGTTPTTTNKTTIYLSPGLQTANNVQVSTSSIGGLAAYPLYIGSRGGASGYCYAKYYSCKIWNAGELVKDLIPAKRNSDGTIGMYDKVTNAFYTNVGSGSFTAGPEIEKSGIQAIVDNYEKLEYIQSSGTQQINTGVYFDMECDSCQVDFCSTVLNQSGMIFASNNSSNYFWFYHYQGTSALSLYIANSGAQANVGNRSWDTRRHKMRYVKKKYYIDDTYCGTDTRSLPLTDYPIYLCSWNNAYFYHGRIYGCKIWKKNRLIRDFVPARRKSDGAIGLYDKITDTFYGNTGSGSFIAGAVVNTQKRLLINNLKEDM